MDLVGGPSLESVVNARGRLTEREACLYMAHTLEALSYLHANRIVHRDLKLANLLLTPDRKRVVLCDFGLAAHLDTLNVGSAPSVCGTPNYVAPELISPSLTATKSYRRTQRDEAKAPAKGDAKRVVYTTSADLWSIGVALYSMLVGSGPFDSEDVPKTFRRIRTARFTFPIGVRLSANAKSLIRMLLSEDANKRPSADEALRHPFFSSCDVSKLFLRDFQLRDMSCENGMLANERVAKDIRDAFGDKALKSERSRADWEDRPDVRRAGEGLSTGRRLGTVNRRMVEVRRWSGSCQQQSPRQTSDSVISSLGNVGVRHGRLNSAQNDSSNANFSARTLIRASKERSSSMSTSQSVLKSQEAGRRSSLNAKSSYGLKEIRWSGLTKSRPSSMGSEKRNDAFSLSVSLSTGLLKGRSILDEKREHSMTETARQQKFEALGKAVNANEGGPPLVRRWLDYTSKYGFATMMADGRNGCCFNDGSIMVYISETDRIPNFVYIRPREEGKSEASEYDEKENGKKGTKGSNDLSKKACLCSLFADMMVEGGRGSLYDLPSACNVSFLKSYGTEEGETVRTASGEEYKDIVHVTEWIRFRQYQVAGFRLSNGSIHMKFDVGEDGCDDFVFNGMEGWLFYRKAKEEQGRYFSLANLGDVSAQSEYLYNQLEVCAQAIAKIRG